MNTIPVHPAVIASLHITGFGLDDFICIGLIALVLVIATFLVRGGEKKQDESVHTEAASPRSVEK